MAALVVACGGGDSEPPPGTPPPTPTPTPSPGDLVVSGTVTFDLVPATVVGLDYGNTVAAPARGITVELVSSTDQVISTAVTGAAGEYSLTAAPNTEVFLRAKAEMVSTATPSWDFRVLDNTNADALYVLDGAAFNTGTQDLVADLHAASGWNGSSYADTRAAAPFAILDLIFDAAALVVATDAGVDFPALDVHWSVDNTPELDADGDRDLTTGEIGSSFYAEGFGIYLLGAADIDTEEYDRHVIAHEWGHYFEAVFSRADNIGGPHSLRDQLDLRVAFGEGFGNALSAMVTGDTVYKDVSGDGQGSAGGFDVEQGGPCLPPGCALGWYSERSVQEILYDLFDAHPDTLEDVLALGFGPIYDVLRNEQVATLGLTSVFSFVDALKARLPAEAASIDDIVNSQNIDDVLDEYGTGETNAGSPASADVLPIYKDLTVSGGPVNVCSTDEYSGSITGGENKLGSRQFLRFSVSTPGTHNISATTTDAPVGQRPDPDMVLHQAGSIAVSSGSPDDDVGCTTSTPLLCEETFSTNLTVGDYVLEVYEWTNTQPEDGDYPPIGRTCFDVEVTL